MGVIDEPAESRIAEEMGMLSHSDQDVILKRPGKYQIIAVAAPETWFKFKVFGFGFWKAANESAYLFPIKTWADQCSIARRIAACWNACCGISIEELEKFNSGVPGATITLQNCGSGNVPTND